MKRLLILLFAASSLTAVGQVPDYLISSNVVMYFDFDGNAIEGVNGDEPLLPSGGIEYAESAERHVLELNGSGAHLYHPDASFPSFETVSMCIEVRLDEFGSGFSGNLVPILSKWESTGTQNNEWLVFESDGKIWLWWEDSFVPGRAISVNHNWTAGEWHTICFEVGARAALWIDGEFVEEKNRDEIGSSNRLFRLGDWNNFQNPNHRSLNGAIDRLAIWASLLTDDTSEAFHLGEAAVPGCTNPEACNYDDNANQEDGSCVACDVATAFCGEGTAWDPETQTCIVANPADINLDGCVQLNDLLDLLSAYGGCEAEASPWICGDPLEYQGYDYATVQIGEQCWFAENLRATQFRDGENLVVADDAQGWMSLEGQGVVALYESTSEVQGHFYSLPAVLHESGICPSGWKVPSDSDWAGLEIEIGMPEEELGNFGYRGVAELIGLQLKSTSGWPEGGNGTDAFGFEGRPAGAINDNDGQHNEQEIISRWWSSTPENATLISRYLRSNEVGFRRLADGTALDGFSIRCLKNFE